jgi:hypothetical protein
LRAKGEALTQTALAALTRLSRQTVAKYQHLIDEFASRVAEPAPRRGGRSPAGDC